MENKRQTQSGAVLKHLIKHGSITSMEAFELYGATRLSGLIYLFRHRDNLTIDSVEHTTKNRFGGTCQYVEYVLSKEDREKLEDGIITSSSL